MPIAGVSFAGCANARDVASSALSAGYRLLDCASIDGNEDQIGEAIAQYEGDRSDLFVVTKLWNDEKRPDAVRAAVERSLQALRCKYLDLLLIHWPIAWRPGTRDIDDAAPLAGTWAAMEGLVDAGLVRQLGVANFDLPTLEQLLEGARIRPVANSVELHPFLAQRKLVGTLLRKGVQCIAHSPTGGPQHAALVEDVDLKTVAVASGRAADELMLKWNMARGVPVLLEAACVERGISFEALAAWKLEEEQVKVRLDALNRDQRCVQPEWATFADAEHGGVGKPSAVFGDGRQYF